MIGVAIIGFGYWGPNLARCFVEAEGCRLISIADPSPMARARAATRHPDVRVVSDWRETLADGQVQAVVIATPVRSHFEIARAALQAGRHVLVEKPITERATDARRLIELADLRGLTLMVDHTFVYSSAVQKMKALIEAGDLGKIYYYDSTRINLGLFQRDVNVIWDLAVHDLAILQNVVDSAPVEISATGISHVPGAPENMAQITLHLESGAVAHLNVNWLAPVKVRRVMVAGTSKMLVWDDLELGDKIKVYDRGVTITHDPREIHEMRVNYRIGDMWAPQLSTTEPLLTGTNQFIDCIASGRRPITDGVAGLQIVEMLEAASRSMSMRGHPVDLQPCRQAS